MSKPRLVEPFWYTGRHQLTPPIPLTFYSLAIIKTPGGQVACTTVAAIGNTTGAAANDPSFTFDVFLHTDGAYYLRATKVGSTSGAFGYTAWATGPIQLA